MLDLAVGFTVNGLETAVARGAAARGGIIVRGADVRRTLVFFAGAREGVRFFDFDVFFFAGIMAPLIDFPYQ
jgi:hypothetical protein